MRKVSVVRLHRSEAEGIQRVIDLLGVAIDIDHCDSGARQRIWEFRGASRQTAGPVEKRETEVGGGGLVFAAEASWELSGDVLDGLVKRILGARFSLSCDPLPIVYILLFV